MPAGRWAVRETAWRTDEPCPVCDAELVLVDDGTAILRAECRLCGYVAPFEITDGFWDGDG
jgi:transcription elongation factor Elf1